MKLSTIVALLLVCIVNLAFSRDKVIQKGTTVTGACLFGTSWGMTFLAGVMVASEEPASERGGIMTVGIPVAGPIVFSAKYGYQADNNPLIWAAYLGLTAAQATGVGLFTRGLIGDKPQRISFAPCVVHNALGLRCNFTF